MARAEFYLGYFFLATQVLKCSQHFENFNLPLTGVFSANAIRECIIRTDIAWTYVTWAITMVHALSDQTEHMAM